MDTKDRTFPYVKSESDGDILEDERICRLCKRVVALEFISEENFDSTKELVICKICVHSVDTHTNFLSNNLKVKQEIDDIGDDKAIEDRFSIKSEEIEIKSEEKFDDIPLHNLKDELADCTSGCQSECTRTTNNFTLKHKRKRHESKDKYRDLEPGDSSEEQIYKCDLCDYTSDQKRNLARHQLSHQSVTEEQMYKCCSCDYKTKRKNNFNQHLLRHKNIPPDQMYKCDLCDYKSGRKLYFIQHRQRHKDVPEEQMYQCYVCDYKTREKRVLKRHMERHKTIPEDQMHKCDLCEYKAGRKLLLTLHNRMHMPEDQMYRCDSCDYRAKRKYDLTQHQLRHKNIPEDQMYKCV